MKGIHLQLSNNKVEKGSFCYKDAHSDHLKKHMHLDNETTHVRISRIYHTLSVRIEWVLKGIVPENQSFQGGEKLILIQIGLFRWFEEIHASLERKPFVWVAGACSTLFLVRIEIVFQRNISWKSEFSRWRKAHFESNRAIQVSWRNTCISWKKTICLSHRSM
jgi:hypothetical protein